MTRNLVIAAHPDDEVLGCGATISNKNKKGDEFYVLILGEGSSCRYLNPDDPAIAKDIEVRKRAFENAMDILNIKKHKLNNIKCGRFDQFPLIEITKEIEMAISYFKPDIVYTHSSTDTNKDHTKVFEATLIATRPFATPCVKSLYSYEVLSSTELQFEKPFIPNTYQEVDINDLEKKWEALQCYSSEIHEFPHPRSKEMVKALAMRRGSQVGVQYAESFSLIRSKVQ